MEETTILCGANADAENYYFNPRYANLPEAVQEELRSLTVLFAEEVGCTLLVSFGEDGDPVLHVIRDDNDFLFDEIEAELQVRRLQREHEELFTSLGEYYRAFFGQEET